MNRTFELPGVVWVALLVGLPMLAQWLETYFGDLPWALPLAGILLIVAKIVTVYGDGSDAPMPDGVMGEEPYHAITAHRQDKVQKVLWG